MKLCRRLLILSLIYTVTLGKPAKGVTNHCAIKEDVKCGKTSCDCTQSGFKGIKWFQYFLSMITKNPPCKCKEVLCSKITEINCVHGACLDDFRGCKCYPCWQGRECNIYQNKNLPTFSSSSLQLKVEKNREGEILAKISASDEDTVLCQDGKTCPCAQLHFEIASGNNDGLFKIDSKSGYLSLNKVMTEKKAKFTVFVKNLDSLASTDILLKDRGNSTLSIEVINEDINMKSNHAKLRLRRSISGAAHSLMLNMRPDLTNKYYFDIGDTIFFSVILSHNTSMTQINSGATSIYLNSTYLFLNYVGRDDPSNVFKSQSLMKGELKITLEKLDATKYFRGNISGTVLDTIGPLSNLFLNGRVETTTSGTGYINGIKSSPVVYAVFPTVNLTKNTGNDVKVYEIISFNMKMSFPKLDYPLLVELTTDIQEFVFMHLKNVLVKNKGSALSYNGTAVAAYHSSNGNHIVDRAVVDFGYMQCQSMTNNELEISFDVEIFDHPSLVNYTTHWMGVGLQAGYRVLWVEQQAMVVTKVEPTLDLNLTSSNITNLVRFYIGDTIIVKYQISHTNTSTADASGIALKCSLTNLKEGKNLVLENSGLVKVGLTSTLQRASTINGDFSVTVADTVTPLAELVIKCNLTYENAAGKKKQPVSVNLTTIVGTPAIILALDTSNKVRVGLEKTFSLKILITRINSPIRIEIVMPTALNESVIALTDIKKAVFGSNLKGYNTSAVPVFNKGKTYPDNCPSAVYDLGTVSNPSNDGNVKENIVQLFFNVVINDHKSVANNTKFWVGAGVIAKPKMIWVGQIALESFYTATPKAKLMITTEVINIGNTGFKYNTTIKHDNSSEKWAFDVEVKYFLPPYIVIQTPDLPSNIVHSKKEGYELFTIKTVTFNTKVSFEFSTNIDKSKAPHDGRVNVFVPVYFDFRDKAGNKQSIIKATHTYFDLPVVPPPTPDVIPVNGYYSRGYFIHNEGVPYTLYVCIDKKFPITLAACYYSMDKGNTWDEVDNRVACIVSADTDGNLYGVARNKVAYLKYVNDVKDWVSVRTIPTSTKGTLFSADSKNADSPSKEFEFNGDEWGADKNGLHFKPSQGTWTLKARWL